MNEKYRKILPAIFLIIFFISVMAECKKSNIYHKKHDESSQDGTVVVKKLEELIDE